MNEQFNLDEMTERAYEVDIRALEVELGSLVREKVPVKRGGGAAEDPK